MKYPITPDGRYFVVKGKLWRTTNPDLPDAVRQALTKDLMTARRAVGAAKRSGDADAMKAARAAVNVAKIALGERGPAWWNDGAPDLNKRMVNITIYADWFASLPAENDP